MALIEHQRTGRPHILGAVHTVGRGSDNDLYLTNELVSGQHAVFRWSGQLWELRDLGSANGTWMDERTLQPGVWQPLVEGARIAFGVREERFEVRDVAPPVPVARPVSLAAGPFGQSIRAQVAQSPHDTRPLYGDASGLALPATGEPLYLIQDGGQGRWFVHDLSENRRRPLFDREVLHIGDTPWQISLPLVPERTRKPRQASKRLADIGLRFYVSADEEHVEIAVLFEGTEQRLPSHVWDYFLLTLARARLRDAEQPALAESEHGWVHGPTLADGLQVAVNTVRAYVHRARRLLANAGGVVDADGLIERRHPAQQLRLGVRWLEVA